MNQTRDTILGFLIIGAIIVFYADIFNWGNISIIIGTVILLFLIFAGVATHRLLNKFVKILGLKSQWSFIVNKEYGVYIDSLDVKHVEYDQFKIHFDNINDFLISIDLPHSWQNYPITLSKRENEELNFEIKWEERNDQQRLIQYFSIDHKSRINEPIASFAFALSAYPFVEKIMFRKDQFHIELDLPLSTKVDILHELFDTLEEFLPVLSKEWNILIHQEN